MTLSRSYVEKFLPDTGEVYDVIVAGGGPAGIGAALAARKQGAKVLVLEARSFFGGVATVSHWMPLNRLYLKEGNRGGVHDLFTAKIKSFGADASVQGLQTVIDGDNLNIHPDYLRLAIFELFEEAGCHYRLHSPITGTVMEGNRVTAVKVQTKNGTETYRAKTFIDATGDGDLAFFSGAKMEKGKEDGKYQTITLSFCLCNVDTAKFFDFFHNHKEEYIAVFSEAEKEGYVISEYYSCNETSVPGFVSVNNFGYKPIMGHIDATDMNELTIVERTGISVAIDFVKIARAKKIPGMEQCYLARVGADLGVRETRRIVGEYVFTIDDVIAGPEFEDVVARRYGTLGSVGIPEDEVYRYKMKSGHAFPYRCFLPLEIEGLLVSGRCASTTHLGQAAGKSMGNMMDFGQATGVAAALAAKNNVTPRRVDVKQIQNILVGMGVKLFEPPAKRG